MVTKKVLLGIALVLPLNLFAGQIINLGDQSTLRGFNDPQVSCKIPLIDVDNSNFVLEAKYKCEVEPTFVHGLFFRKDTYITKAEVNFGKQLGKNISFGVGPSAQLEFIRVFPDFKEALMVTPYWLPQVPVDSETAMGQLKINDSVRMVIGMNLIASVSEFNPIGAGISVGASTHVLLSGHFLVDVYKLDENNRFRVRLIALRNKEVAASLGVKLDGAFNIFGLKIPGSIVEKVFDNPFEMGFQKNKMNTFLVDYIFNLNDAGSKQAFNQIMISNFNFQHISFDQISMVNQILLNQDPNSLQQNLLANATKAEEMYNQDLALPYLERRVDRLYKGESFLNNLKIYFSLGIPFLNFSSASNTTTQKLSYIDRNGVQKNFNLYTASTTTKGSFFNRDVESRSASKETFGATQVLTTATHTEDIQDQNALEMVDLSLLYEIKARELKDKHIDEFQTKMQTSLPNSIYQQILKDWSKVQATVGSKNTFIGFDLKFNKTAADYIAQSSDFSGYMQLKSAFDNYISKHPLKKQLPLSAASLAGCGSDSNYFLKLDCESSYIADHLSTAFNSKYAIKERLDALILLKDSLLFKEVGAGFLMAHLPAGRAELAKMIYLTFKVEAEKQPTYSFQFPANTVKCNKDVYYAAKYNSTLFSDRAVDLRANLEEASDNLQSGFQTCN